MTEKRQGMRGCAHIGDGDFVILPMVMADGDGDVDGDGDDGDGGDGDGAAHLQLAISREERLCKSRRLRGAKVSNRGRAESWDKMIFKEES